jgi:hypothetical protein
MDNRKDSVSGAHSTENLQSLIPHMPIPPQELCPFSSQQSLGFPTSLSGLQQQAEHEVSEPYNCSLAPLGNHFPNNSLIQREFSHGLDNPPLQYPMGLTTCFFSPAPKLTATQTDMASYTGSGPVK